MLSLSIKLPIKNFSIKVSKTIGDDPERQLLLVFDNPVLDGGFFLWAMEKNQLFCSQGPQSSDNNQVAI